MKIEPDSVIWMYPGGAKSDLIYENRFEAFLFTYEERLVDEYLKCQAHLNLETTDSLALSWWLGSQERIEMEVEYLKKCGIIFDKVFDAIDHMYVEKCEEGKCQK
jgi:hypothetical protein